MEGWALLIMPREKEKKLWKSMTMVGWALLIMCAGQCLSLPHCTHDPHYDPPTQVAARPNIWYIHKLTRININKLKKYDNVIETILEIDEKVNEKQNLAELKEGLLYELKYSWQIFNEEVTSNDLDILGKYLMRQLLAMNWNILGSPGVGCHQHSGELICIIPGRRQNYQSCSI